MGFNPLDIISGGLDAVKGGADWFGNELDKINPLGINLGIGAVPRFIGNFVPGMAHLAAAGVLEGYGALTGTDQSAASDYLGQAASSFGKGMADTATDLTTFGGLAPWSNALEKREEGAYGYKPRTAYDYATSGGQGLGGAILTDALNVSLVAGGVEKALSSGTVGDLAKTGNLAAQGASADVTGAVTANSARASAILLKARDLAGGEGLSGDNLTARAQSLADAATKRASQLEIVNKFQKPVRSVFQNILRPVGTALNAASVPDVPITAEAAPKVDVPQPGAATPPEQFSPVPTAKPGDTVVYHGDNPAEVRDGERWFTRNRNYAENQAGPNGKVYAHTLPDATLTELEKKAGLENTGAQLGPARSQAAVDAGPVGMGTVHDLGGDVKTAEAVPKTVAENAAGYKASKGIEDTGRPVPANLEVNNGFHQKVAEAYDAMKSEPNHPRVRAAYQALLHETGDQFHYMTEDPAGPHLQVEFHDAGQKGSPYYAGGASDEVAHQRMLDDVRDNNHLWVNKTLPNEAHSVFTPEQNDIFRAVHDYFGHAAAGNNFGRAGEEIAYRMHSQMYSDTAREALATETRGQNSWLNFSGHNDLRRAAGEPAEFPVQKAGILPDYARDEYPLLPQREGAKMTPSEISAHVQANRPTPAWAEKIAPFVPPGIRAVAKYLDNFALNREATAVLRENTRLIRAAAAGARLSPLVVEAIDVAKNHLVEGGMDPAEANVAIGQRATVLAGAGPIYTDLLAKVDAGDMPSALLDKFVSDVTGSPLQAIQKDLDTPEFRTRIEGLAQMYAEEKAKALDALSNEARQAGKGLENTESSAPSLTKGDQSRMSLIQELQAKAQALREQSAPLERIQQQADILQGRERLGALGATRQAALADQAQAVADFDRARAPLSMRDDKVWGEAIDTMVRATLDPDGFGGTTFSQHTNAAVSAETGATFSVGVLPETAIIVPLTGTVVVDAEHLATAIDEVGHRYQDLLRDPDTVLGTWTKDGQVHIDVSQTTINGRPLSIDQSDILAAARKQQATWDFQNGAERVPLLPQDIAIDLASTNMRQTARVMNKLRTEIDRINDQTDPRTVARRPDVLISPDMVDAYAAVMQRNAVMAFRNNPGRWADADSVFGGLDIKYASEKSWRSLREASGADPLFQRFQDRILGAFVPADPGTRAIVGFTRDANIGTLFHESANWMRTLIGPDDMGQLERAYGITDGIWKAGHEERFAENFMQYLEDGRGPVETAGIFAKIRNWLGGAWRIITRSGSTIDPEVSNVLDNWFHPDAPDGPIDTLPTLPMPKDESGASLRQLARRVPESAKFESPAQAAKRGAAQQAALDKYSAAVTRARDAEIATKKAQATVAKMEDLLQQPTSAELTAGALTGRIEKLAGKVQDHLNNPTANRTPPAWQPVLRAAQSIADMVKDHPELEPILADLPKTFGDAVTRLDEAGFDPTHLSDWSTGKVRGLAYGTARLGPADRGVGTEVTATSRKARSGYLASHGLVNRSIESMAAMIAEPMQEARSNHVVDFMERNWTQQVGHGQEVPKGWTLWSPVKRGLLGVETPLGESQAIGSQTIIPTEVARVLRRYSAPGVDNPMLRALQRVQSPWKSLLLTWSPKFYLNHILGHVVLASLAGAVKLSDWTSAYQLMRGGFKDLPEVTAQSLVQAELGSTAFVGYPSIKTARAGGGNLEVVAQVSKNLHRVVNTADSFARAAVYIADVRKGLSPEAALQHAAEALVDYNDLNALERSAVRAIVPFYGFQKGVLRLVMRMPLDHPIATGMMIKIGQLNEKWAVDANGDPLPSAYSGVLDVPGLGMLDSKPINPLKDAQSLVTPEGIMGSLHPIVKMMVNAAVGAPAVHVDGQGRIVANRGQTFHIGPTGAPVANIDPNKELTSLFENTPQLSAAGASIGAGSQPGLAGVLSAILPLKNPDTLKAAADRMKSTEVALPRYGPEQAAAALAKFQANQGGGGASSSPGGLSGVQDAIAGGLATGGPSSITGPLTATQRPRLPSHGSGGKKRSRVSQKGRILQAAYSRRGGSFHMKNRSSGKLAPRIGK